VAESVTEIVAFLTPVICPVRGLNCTTVFLLADGDWRGDGNDDHHGKCCGGRFAGLAHR
jgi:hypothetical protein